MKTGRDQLVLIGGLAVIVVISSVLALILPILR
jgi:hypothetical protein